MAKSYVLELAEARDGEPVLTRDALPGDGGFYRISQGREVGHDAIIELRVDDAGEVWSGGRARTIVNGTIDWY